jgi:outer membrane receptor protein involved in Fe transport
MEHTDRVLDDYSLDKQYILNQWNFFPSAGMNYKTEGGFTWKASYSRRIERTTTNMMNPFLSRRHSEVLEVGDPELRPELVDALELGAIKDFKSSTLFANVYYRKVNDVINQVNSVFNDSILYRTYTNAGISTVKGLELGADLNPTDWWKIYLGGNLYQFDIRGNIIGEQIERNSWNYSFNINSIWDLGKNWDMVFNFNYLSRIVTIQGEKSNFFSPNLTFKKDLMDGRMSLGLLWKAIGMNWLGSNRQTITGSGEGFFTTTDYIQERDMVVLTVSYRINQLTKKLNFNKSEFGDREF